MERKNEIKQDSMVKEAGRTMQSSSLTAACKWD